jgi:uncharacterized membrane protein (DUF4010 family)
LAAALLANVASLSLFIPILLAMAPAYLHAIRFELAAAIAVLVLLSVFGLRYSRDAITESSVAQKRMFRIQHVLALVAIIAAILFLTAYLNEVLGSEWAVALALFASAAELHAALVGVAELSKAGALPHPEWGFFGLLLVSFTVKTGIAWYAGGRDFAWRFGAAMLTALGVVAAVILLRG